MIGGVSVYIVLPPVKWQFELYLYGLIINLNDTKRESFTPQTCSLLFFLLLKCCAPLLFRNMTNLFLNIYKTSKWNSRIQGSPWWANLSLTLSSTSHYRSDVFNVCVTNRVLFFLQSFTLEFHFEPNDFFTNTVLTKTYKMRSEPDENDPFSFDGPEIMSCTGWGYNSAKYHVTMFIALPLMTLLFCFSQLHHWLDEGQKRHIENNQEETEAQGPRDSENGHQNSPQRLLF